MSTPTDPLATLGDSQTKALNMEAGRMDSQTMAVGTPSMRKRGKCVIWIGYLAMVVYLYGLPLWSRLTMDHKYCWTPAEDIVCGDGQDYMDIARRLNRQVNGTYYGCDCGEGLFRDWVCPINSRRLAEEFGLTRTFSISYFISTAPGTGCMAAFTIWPILSMWWYGAGQPGLIEHRLGLEVGPNEFLYRKFLRATLVLFQFCFGLFLINTLCMAPSFHTYSVMAFLASAVLHFLAVAWRVGWKTKIGCVIRVMVLIAVVSIAVGTFWPVSSSYLGTHAFFLAEATGLTMGFGIAPVLSLIE